MIKNIRTLTRKIRQKFRIMTASLRPLPDFIIIGAQKAGTTSLYDYLAQHNQVKMSTPLKEVHYFSYDYSKGANWYRSNFPIVINKSKKHILVGEASPYYLYHPHSAKRIKDLLPDIKLIAILRNPTDRAISHYFHELRHNTENLPIKDALDREEARIEPELKKMQQDENWESKIHQNQSYKARGRYDEQLSRYFDLFNRDNILILTSDDVFKNTKNCISIICKFLKIDNNIESIDTTPKNIGHNKEEVETEVYQYLNDYFKSENEKLSKSINQELPW